MLPGRSSDGVIQKHCYKEASECRRDMIFGKSSEELELLVQG